MRVAVIGAGMAGILSSIKLAELGIEHVVFEKADRLGGTWRGQHLPGLSCDVPAHCYYVLLRPQPGLSGWFRHRPEIQAYFERGSPADFGVVPRIRFGDEVTQLHWEAGRWSLGTASGQRDGSSS